MSEPSAKKEVRVDAELYAKLQGQFLEKLVVAIRDQLEFAKVSPEQMDQATKGISFQVANIIDGTSRIAVGEKSVRSVLTFAEDNHGNKLVAPEGFSGMHSHTYKISEAVLKRPKDKENDKE